MRAKLVNESLNYITEEDSNIIEDVEVIFYHEGSSIQKNIDCNIKPVKDDLYVITEFHDDFQVYEIISYDVKPVVDFFQKLPGVDVEFEEWTVRDREDISGYIDIKGLDNAIEKGVKFIVKKDSDGDYEFVGAALNGDKLAYN